MISIRSQVATAVRYANVVYASLPDDRAARDRFAALWLDLERQVNTAEAAGDVVAISAAIAEWRATVNERFGSDQ